MPYRSLLTVWDGAEDARPAFDTAINLAERWSSHLDIVCVGVDRTPTGFYAAELAHEMVHDFFGQAKAEAEAHAKEARAIVDHPDLAWSVRPAALRFGELPTVIGKAAWFQDLVVLPAPFGRRDEDLAEAVLDAALFNTPAPSLIVPGEAVTEIGARILVAWNGSLEAARALRASLPLLTTADAVNAVMVDPGARKEGCADPGAALGAMLSRHGVNAEISLLPQSAATVAETLAGRAADIDADLIVMGAYGHSRFRERMLGGATRDMLKTAELPILFAR